MSQSEHGYTHLSESAQTRVKEVEKATEEARGTLDFAPTDLGMAERMRYFHEQELRYVPAWGQWLFYDGRRWKADAGAKLQDTAKKLIRGLEFHVAEDDEETRQAQIKLGLKYESGPKLSAMLSLARNEFQAEPEDFDTNKLLLNMQNGTLRLGPGAGGRLMTARPLDSITRLAPVEFDPEAKCPRWEQFVNEIMGGSQNLVDFLRRVCGYALTGLTTEQCFFIFYGRGANGKTTFLEVMHALLGDYAKTASTDTFLSRRPGAATNDVAALRGARFVSAVESDDGRRLAEALVKRITGGDRMTARFYTANPSSSRPS